MTSSQRIRVTDESQVGEARRLVVSLCQRSGANETFVGKAAILTTELATNMVRHAGGGELILRELTDLRFTSIELLALDRGPGLRNPSECMRDGFSTIGTAGTGLGSIKRIAEEFEIFSPPTGGTIVWTRLCMDGPHPQPPVEMGAVNIPTGLEQVSGDAWEVMYESNKVRIMVVDGLGHGPFAEEAAREAVATFRANMQTSPAQTLEMAHSALIKTRGAAGAIVEIIPGQSEAISAGVGNISMRLVDADLGTSKSFICDNGTLGANVRKVQQYKHKWPKNGLLVMHSDGLATAWDLKTYPGLARRHPGLIAGVLYRDFKRDRDDVTVVVTRLVSDA